MNGVTLQGMVLSSMPIGEYDNRVVLLTMERGKISAFARGARRQGSPLAAFCRPFATGYFTIYESRTANSLKEARILNYFEELSLDMDSLYLGYYFLEFADYYSREGGDERLTMRLLYCALQGLLKESIPGKLVRLVYEMKLLMMNGDFEGIPERLSPGASHALRFILDQVPERLFTFALSDEVFREVSAYCDYLKARYIRREFRSLRIREEMKDFMPASEEIKKAPS